MLFRLGMKLKTGSQEQAKNTGKANTYSKVRETQWQTTSKPQALGTV